MREVVEFAVIVVCAACWAWAGYHRGRRKEAEASRERAHRAFLNGMGLGISLGLDMRQPFTGGSGPIAEIAAALDSRAARSEVTQ